MMISAMMLSQDVVKKVSLLCQHRRRLPVDPLRSRPPWNSQLISACGIGMQAEASSGGSAPVVGTGATLCIAGDATFSVVRLIWP